MDHNSQLDMHYGACSKKIESRYQTIIKPYQDHYNLKSLPLNKQYWTICGRCSYEKGKLEDNCEPDQLIKAGFIIPEQFHGVEIDQEIYNWNKQSDDKINWYFGDYYETMIKQSNHDNFNPAIVSADMLLMPKFAAQYFSKIMQFATTCAVENIMLVGNLVTEFRHQRTTIKDIVENLEKQPCFQFAMNNAKWAIHPLYYWYNGTGETTTKMTTIILFKGE